jgi:hypothetical protein
MPGDMIAQILPPPPFQRMRRVQVHVGALPRGVDLERGLPRTTRTSRASAAKRTPSRARKRSRR